MVGNKQVKKPKSEVATIDCELITIETKSGNEFGFDTANKIAVEPQIEETEAVKLVVKGILRAQKQKQSTITGNKITLSDNVFNAELVLVVQGGEIIFDPENPDEIVGYNPPVAGSADKGETFRLNAYTAQYDASGQIVKYERISYPNCTGTPISFNSEDGAFRAPEYEINSAPKEGESPYNLTYVKSLPRLVDEYVLGTLDLAVSAGTDAGKTKVTVDGEKDEYTDVYKYKVESGEPTLPRYGEKVTGYTDWDGIEEITAGNGSYVAVVECDKNGKAIAGAFVEAVVNVE